jgi:hypothetical protein
LPEDVRPRATQSASSSSPLSRAGEGRAQNTAPCCSRDRAAARSGTSTRSSLVVVIVVGGSTGGAPVAAVAGQGGSGRRGSGGGDNDMLLLWDVVVCFVFLGGDACGVCAETWCAS